jgi:hypothetical protein
VKKVSKENNIRKKSEGPSKQTPSTPAKQQTAARRPLTDEEKARIIKNRLANRPVIVFRYPNGKYNKRFVFTLALMIVAFIAIIYFLSRW